MLFIGNGKVITRDGGAFFENGAVVTDGEKIAAVGDGAALRRQYPDAELIDAHGGTIMPGLINMHNHIYSAFARGLSIRGYAPKDFSDILEGQWWKIDRHLTHENNRLSALAVYADCIKNGVTTVFDHHASYFDVPGSLDDIASAATELGVRASLCYEVSDRDGEKKAMEAVLENERFILRAQQEGSDMLHGMMGLHASFTVSDETLRRCEAHRHGAGLPCALRRGPGRPCPLPQNLRQAHHRAVLRRGRARRADAGGALRAHQPRRDAAAARHGRDGRAQPGVEHGQRRRLRPRCCTCCARA